MFKTLKTKKASSIVEYMIVVMFLLAVFFVFQNYIVRGFSGRWKAVGDSFGGGQQYDPKSYAQGGTLECFYYTNQLNAAGARYWVETRCYEDCLRARNGFGDPAAMAACRGQCSESNALYQDCRNTNYSI